SVRSATARAVLLLAMLMFPPGYASTAPGSTARTLDILRASPPRFAAAPGRPCRRARARRAYQSQGAPGGARAGAWKSQACSIDNQPPARRHWPAGRADDRELRDGSGRRWRGTRRYWLAHAA